MATTINGKLANSAQVLDGLEANLSPRGPAQDQYVITYDDATGTLIFTPGGGGVGMANPMTNLGDLIFGQVGGAPDRLPIATPGYTLRVGASGVPEWSEHAAFGTLVTRPVASGLNEGEAWWITDADPGLELSFSTHTDSGVWGWVTLPYGVTATGANLVQAVNPAGGRTALGLGGAAVLSVGTTAGTVAAGDDARLSNSRAFASLVITAPGGGVLSVVGSLVDSNAAPVQGIVQVFLDDSAGAAGILTPLASVGTILPPTIIPVTRLWFQILTTPLGAFAYTATGTGAAGVCTQVHASVNALNQQSVAIT